MTPLLTEAEREAVERLSHGAREQNSGPQKAGWATDAETVCEAIERLLSARAVPMETVAWAVTNEGVVNGNLYPSELRARGVKSDLDAEYSKEAREVEPLVLRSAAEAYTAGMREALERLLTFLPSQNDEAPQDARIPLGFCYVRWSDIKAGRDALATRALTDTTTEPKGAQ